MAFTLDVGHARNNGIFAQRYPLSRWYELLGREAGAYHLHQTVRREGVLSNHRAIESWFGPMINFSSFLYAWEKGILRKAPVFLEVKGASPFETSRLAFRADFGGEARK